MPDAPTPSNANPIATATQPQTTVAPTPATPPPGDDLKLEVAQLKRELENKKRENVIERRKHEKTFGEKLSRLGELEKQQALARSRPTEFLKTVYGEKWQEHLREILVSGAAPAELIQGEVERMRDEFKSELSRRDEEQKKQQEAQQQAQLDAVRRELFVEAADFATENEKEFLFVKRTTPQKAAAIIAQRIEHEFNEARRRGEAEPRALSVKAAAELIENEVLGYVENAFDFEKYRTKFADKLQLQKEPGKVAPAPTGARQQPVSQQQPPQQQQTEQQQPRRTLTNNLTGTTAARPALSSDDERLQRALAARARALESKRTG
jgi:hypothetical protein